MWIKTLEKSSPFKNSSNIGIILYTMQNVSLFFTYNAIFCFVYKLFFLQDKVLEQPFLLI